MTVDELSKEKSANILEISNIQNQIVSQAAKYAVNELYGRLNYLTERNIEIGNQLNLLGQTKGGTSGNQLEKAISISSGGGVAIRPSNVLLANPDNDPKKPGGSTQTPGPKVIAGNVIPVNKKG